jgi:hypothetical protein
VYINLKLEKNAHHRWRKESQRRSPNGTSISGVFLTQRIRIVIDTNEVIIFRRELEERGETSTLNSVQWNPPPTPKKKSANT